MLQNCRVTAIIVLELLRENQLGGGGCKITTPPPRLGLSKQQALDANPKVIQQISFTANLERARNTRFYFFLEEAKETIFEFSQGPVKVL